MKIKLLIISVLGLLCAAFADAGNDFFPEPSPVQEIFVEYLDNQEISAPQQKLLLPRQTNLASAPQIRTAAKRNISQRNQFRYIFFISGKAVDRSFVKTYRQLFQHFSSGLMTPFRHHLSLGRLII